MSLVRKRPEQGESDLVFLFRNRFDTGIVVGAGLGDVGNGLRGQTDIAAPNVAKFLLRLLDLLGERSRTDRRIDIDKQMSLLTHNPADKGRLARYLNVPFDFAIGCHAGKVRSVSHRGWHA